MTDTILCIDIGTTSLKTALLSDKREVRAYSRIEFGGGRASDEWLNALCKATNALRKEEKYSIEAICVSGNGPTIVSEDGTTLLWNERAEKPNVSTDSIFIPRFDFFKKKYQNEWKNSAAIFGGFEFVLFKLTGNAISLLPSPDFSRAYWTNDELFRTGFTKDDAKKLPPFVNAGNFVGKITANAAIKTGLLEGTLVFAGAPDFFCALIGTGTIFPGKICDRAGSSEGLNLCTKKAIFADGIRTLPSVIPGRWNASILIPESGRLKSENPQKLLDIFCKSVEKLKNEAKKNGEDFSDEIKITGGQSKDLYWILQKEEASKTKIIATWCSDAELIGDLILARVALGDYDDITEACEILC